MINHECDKCGTVARGIKGKGLQSPAGWYMLVTVSQPSIRYHICIECRGKLGIPPTAPEKDVAVRLLEILREIAEESAEAVREGGP